MFSGRLLQYYIRVALAAAAAAPAASRECAPLATRVPAQGRVDLATYICIYIYIYILHRSIHIYSLFVCPD